MNVREEITLTRDCPAVEIPSGYPQLLKSGAHVTLSQSLGGNFTVITDYGYMVQIAGKDADALGKERPAAPAAPPPGGPVDKELVWEQLRTVYDPEIPVNIVDLGLVYLCELHPAESGGTDVRIQMTMTAPGCGMGDILRQDIQRKLTDIPGIQKADVEVVFDPPWDRSRMSEAAQLQLGML